MPGPRLAALTAWVETFYNCFRPPGGQFIWKYQEWHKKYDKLAQIFWSRRTSTLHYPFSGPIVHIGSNEAHIQDPTFYEILYSNTRHLDKLKWLEHRFNNELSLIATSKHSNHRSRRAGLNPFSSKLKIAQYLVYSPNIQDHMERRCQRVKTEFTGNGSALSLTNMWGVFAADIVVGYCLKQPYNFIIKPDFRAEFSDAM